MVDIKQSYSPKRFPFSFLPFQFYLLLVKSFTSLFAVQVYMGFNSDCMQVDCLFLDLTKFSHPSDLDEIAAIEK